MTRQCLALWVGATLLVELPAARADIQVGAAVQVITPSPLLPVSGGLGRPNPTREKRGELTARAVVFRKGEVTVAVVALDLLGFPSVLGDRVRAKVNRIPAQNILIASTHTHSAPDCYAFPDGDGGHTGDLKYMDFVCDRATLAITAALDQLQPASIRVATGEAKGKIAYNYYAPDLYDRRMSIIQALNAQGKPIATLVNYAIHPEVLGNNVGILSPDLVGPLCDKIESKAGGVALFVNGAQGGMITADNRDLNRPRDPQRAYWVDARTWEECLRIGHLMADEALRIVADAPRQEDPTLFCDAISVRFPVDSLRMWSVVVGSPLKYPHNADQSINARINLVNLGNAQILTIPGEALPNIGFYLKRKMHGGHNLLFGLTNDAFGYILTKVDFQSFPRYDYVSRTSLGEMTGEILIEKSLALVNRSPRPDNKAEKTTPPAELAKFFRPPEKHRSDLGNFRSPLIFADGKPVKTAADWQDRRREILSQWHEIMGPWPALIDRPRVETVRTTRRDSVTQHQLRLGIALGAEMVDAFLLVPEGKGPFPAVLVAYYDAQTGIGLGAKLRDYGWQLAKRGFVTLSIGKPNAGVDFESPDKVRGGPYLGPVGQPVRVQPLSALAYTAANAHTVLAQRADVLLDRIGIVGHSFGGKWALFASCLHDKFACAVWSDPGIVFDERDRRKENPSGSVNYWDVWYLGFERGEVADPKKAGGFRKLPSEGQARTGAYKTLVEHGHDLVELHALMAPRPFLVSGGTADLPERWPALNHAIAVNKLLGHEYRVAMTNREGHAPTEQANERVYRFFEWWLKERN
jgi:hypothetical protein